MTFVKDPHRYDDMLEMPHFVSKNRRHMSNYDRAAQFAPFDALTGYDEAIEETGRTTESEITLGESQIERLDRCFRIVAEHLEERPLIEIVVFEPDLNKEGGRYLRKKLRVRRIDLNSRILIAEDRQQYDLDYICEVESELFDHYDID